MFEFQRIEHQIKFESLFKKTPLVVFYQLDSFFPNFFLFA